MLQTSISPLAQFPLKQGPVNWKNMWVGLSVKRMSAEGKSPKTIDNYRRSIRQFTGAFKKHPKTITQEEIKNYLFKITKEKNFEPATHNLHVSGIKYFYNHVLGIEEKNEALIKKRVPLKLFEVFSQSELTRVFQAEKILRNRLLIKAGYAFGLRVNSAVALKLSDFDFKRNLLFIKGDKGKKDRFVMLSRDFIQELNNYLSSTQIKDYLFPGSEMETHITGRFANYILHRAAERAGISKSISFHTLRRSYATHLHEAGHSLRDIQVLMGHSTSRTIERYTRVSNKHISQTKNPLDSLTGIAQEAGTTNFQQPWIFHKILTINNQIKFHNQLLVNSNSVPPIDKILAIGGKIVLTIASYGK